MKLLVDFSSIGKTAILKGSDPEHGRIVEHDGKSVQVNGWLYGYDRFMTYLCNVIEDHSIAMSDVVIVCEPKNAKARRQLAYPLYKAQRKSTAPEVAKEISDMTDAAVSALCARGASAVIHPGVEADDVIAHLCETLPGKKMILSHDQDMCVLTGPDVSVYGIRDNPFGPFNSKYITVYKALVGDSSDNIKGAPGFGEKAFTKLLIAFDLDNGLAALEKLILDKNLAALFEDVEHLPELNKIINGANSVYASYNAAKMHPEWVVNLENMVARAPLFEDPRLKKFEACDRVNFVLQTKQPKFRKDKHHCVFDIEIIGDESPVFLACFKIVETGEKFSFWLHVQGDMSKMRSMFARKDLTFVSFNGIHFDGPMCSGALSGMSAKQLKIMASFIITNEAKSWITREKFGYTELEFDHIDLIEPAPGVMISLKTYAGRMGYKTMMDMPIKHDRDVTPEQLPIIEQYCFNDCGVTEMLFSKLRQQIDLRIDMSNEYGIDLRSKSDAQIAEAVLKKAAGIHTKPDWDDMPASVKYKAPDFIQTDSSELQELIDIFERTDFIINRASGQVVAPEFLSEELPLGYGTYKLGVGGLHSTHDERLYVESTGELMLSDFDVGSYYPFIMINAGITPRIANGAEFVAVYKKILFERMEAKARMIAVEREIDEIERALNG